MYRVFFKYCVFFEILNIFWTLASLGFTFHQQRCSRTRRVQKNHNILKGKNTIFHENPVCGNNSPFIDAPSQTVNEGRGSKKRISILDVGHVYNTRYIHIFHSSYNYFVLVASQNCLKQHCNKPVEVLTVQQSLAYFSTTNL